MTGCSGGEVDRWGMVSLVLGGRVGFWDICGIARRRRGERLSIGGLVVVGYVRVGGGGWC